MSFTGNYADYIRCIVFNSNFRSTEITHPLTNRFDFILHNLNYYNNLLLGEDSTTTTMVSTLMTKMLYFTS